MENEKHFAVVNGLALGEETKGNTVQALVRELNAHTVWRSGGWQGGHHIIHDDGREVALNHFGAGIFEGANTYLKHMVISPVDLFEEAATLEALGVPNPLKRIFVDQSCLVTTPFHRGISRTREILRGKNKKGTIGVGVGEAIRDSENPNLAIRAGELRDRAKMQVKVESIRAAKLKIAEELLANFPGQVPPEIYSEIEILKDRNLVDLVVDSFSYFADLVKIVDDSYLDSLLFHGGSIVNEVSHGTLHHPRFGFTPHVTQIDPTSGDVLATIKAHDYDGHIMRIGVTRTYLTRHGAGPLVSFDRGLTNTFKETHNDGGDDWLGPFRVGYFDTVALRYAIDISGGKSAFSGLFVSYMDVLAKRKDWQVCDAYEYKGNANNLADYFVVENNHIIGIRVHSDIDKDEHERHQIRLTQLLNECVPITNTLFGTKEQPLEQVFLGYVGEKLGVPVVGTACGPKVTDKVFLPAWQNALKR